MIAVSGIARPEVNVRDWVFKKSSAALSAAVLIPCGWIGLSVWKSVVAEYELLDSLCS
jgi:hypothetical protein